MTSPRNLLKAWELKPKKHLGQNFLTDPSTARTIIARANLTPDDIVLEIGAGLGELAGKTWRIGLMGYASNERNVLSCLNALEAILGRSGAAINKGVTLDAAQEVFTAG